VNELRAYAHATIHTAALWDVLGALGALPAWWPPVSYVLAGAGIVAACLAVLFAILAARRGSRVMQDTLPPADIGPGGAAPAGTRTPTGGQLLAIGILLGVWLLRGDAEIPPDLPLVAAEVLAAALYAVFTLRRRK
jgi:hypothetical protein